MNSIPQSIARLLALLVALLAAVLGWRLIDLQRYATGQIIGGSMVPAYAGSFHYRVVCDDCGFPFACDAEMPPYRNLAVCPNCGYAENDVGQKVKQPGESVRIDRRAVSNSLPPRWSVVAFESPDDSGTYNVKRLVGLPGEQVAIQGGQLYLDGRLARKSLAQLRQLATLVYDDTHRPTKTPNLPARWQGEAATTAWRATDEGYACEARTSEGEPDWLSYRHWSCMSTPLARTRETPVLDNDSYNQSVSRELNEVGDLLLSCRIAAQGEGAVLLRLHDGRDWVEAKLPLAGGDAILRRTGLELARMRVLPRILAQGAALEFALCDGQALLAIDGETIFAQSYASEFSKVTRLARPVAIGVAGARAQVEKVRVLRDLHYLEPLGTARDWSAERPLADDEVFVLGDNGAVSRDSRFWKPGSVTKHSLLGRVLR